MGYASKSGRADTSSSNPRAHAICMRCGFRWNWDRLQFQYDWRGTALTNTFLRVCPPCYDTPQEQLRAIVVPADPLPKVWATPEPFLQDETNFRAVSTAPVIDPDTGLEVPQNNFLLTQDGQFVTLIPMGAPNGLDPNAIMPLAGNQHFGTILPVTSVIADVMGKVNVTCSAPHGMADNSQVAAMELTNRGAEGFFSVTVLSASSFSYQPIDPPRPGSLLTDSTRIVTAKVGLPLGYQQIPLV